MLPEMTRDDAVPGRAAPGIGCAKSGIRVVGRSLGLGRVRMTGEPSVTTGLLERTAEVAAIERRVRAALDGLGGCVLVEGQAGIGKSRLMDAARSMAAAAGVRVLSASGDEWERGFAFGVMRQLFEPVLARATAAERAELLGGAARLASTVLEPTVQEPADSSLAGAHGLYWLTANLAERGPLLLVVDDAHWADAPSLRAIAYQVRRLADLPVLVLLTARTAAPPAAADLLDAIRAEPSTTSLRPSPLSRDAAAALVRAGLGAEADDEFCAECHRAAAGNPMLLSALVGALREARVRPSADRLAAVWERAPRIMASFVRPRLRELPPDAVALIRAVSLLGSGAELRHAAALAGVAAPPAPAAADELVAAELLAPGRPLRFTHPLVGQAVYEELTPAERHAGHLRAARLLADEGAPAESVAAHLLEVERFGDGWVVLRLREAAEVATGKGAPAAAVTYLRRALAEPPDATMRPRVLHELGLAQARAEPARACATLEAAHAAGDDPLTRASIALELGRTLLAVRDSARGLPLLEKAIDELAGAHPALRLRLEAELINAARLDPATRAFAYRRLDGLRDAAVPGTAGGCVLLATTAFRTAQVPGLADEAALVAERSLAGLRSLGEEDSEAHLQCLLVLMACARLDTALAACDDAADRARHHGSGIALATATGNRAAVALRGGSVPDALTDAKLAHELAVEFDASFARQFALAVAVVALVERGATDEATDLLTAAGGGGQVAYPEFAAGRLYAATGRLTEAYDRFMACGQRLELREMLHPGAMPWRAEAALVAHGLGRSAAAARLADEAVDVARRYRSADALGVALWAAGLVHGDVSLLESAVTSLAATPCRLDHARALVDLGAALRRAKRRGDAREPLRAGLDLAHRCGADALAARARTELVATGLRPRSPARTGRDALTPSERRIAALAGGGRSNRDIAQHLFVTVKTVEVHLGNAYRKLGITSRAQLTTALTDPTA